MQMETNFAYIDENYKRIVDAMEEAKAKYRKPSDDITLMAVTKTVAPEAVNHAISCGIHTLGENRVQEYLSKKDFYSKDAKVHFIGHLQTNKVKYIIGRTALIHSLDRIELAEEIEKRSEKAGVVTKCLVQVNSTGIEGRFGVSPEETLPFLEQLKQFDHIAILGLMGMAPAGGDAARSFKSLKILFDKATNQGIWEHGILSMGMSSDFETAILCGTTMIRLGRSLFGNQSEGVQ